MITAHLQGEQITSTSSEAFALYEKSRFGEKTRNKIRYSFSEALYLLEKQKAEILANNKHLHFDSLIKKLRKFDKRIEIKYTVYSDLRNSGYILKTALKFGADFRVYRKGVKPGEDHALWIVFCVPEYDAHSWHDFAAKNRVAHSTKKNLLLAIVDDEDDVTYYEVSWLKP